MSDGSQRLSSRVERLGAALVPAGLLGVFVHAALRGAGLSEAADVALSSVITAGALFRLARIAPASLDGALKRRPALCIGWLVLGLATVAATARLAAFMVDETRAGRSIYPFDEFFVHHSCLSAQYRSAQAQQDGVRNVYERTLYEGPDGEPRLIGTFVTDVFLYPPSALLLSGLALSLSDDFYAWRAIWFAIEGVLFGFALLWVAAWIGGRTGARAALLAPIVWLSVPLLLTLQIGNFHLIAFGGGMLGKWAIERGRIVIGSSILAMLAAIKLFPGILVLLLLFQRRFRVAATTAATGILVVGATALAFGTGPFVAFFSYHLPRLSSGAALETLFARPDNIAASHAIFSLVQKLGLLGVAGMSQAVAATASWAYTLALVGAAALAARAAGDNRSKALVWLALLQLASLRSPFTPDVYAQVPLLWMLTLLLAAGGTWRRLAGLAALVALANLVVPAVPLMEVRTLVVLTVLHQLLFLGFAVVVLTTEARRAPVTA